MSEELIQPGSLILHRWPTAVQVATFYAIEQQRRWRVYKHQHMWVVTPKESAPWNPDDVPT